MISDEMMMIFCPPQNDLKVQCVWVTSCCHVVTWNAETFFSLYLSVSSLDLGCIQKTEPGDWRRFVSYSHDSSEMDVGVSKSHVFLNYSPRALFSQWDTHLHGGAVCSSVLRPLNTLHCWPTSSAFCVCLWVVVLAVWQKELAASVGWLMEWLEVANFSKWYAAGVAAFSAVRPAVRVTAAAVWLGAFKRSAQCCLCMDTIH